MRDIGNANILSLVGGRVKRLRVERRLTARALAERAGLSLRTVAQLESGRANIALGRLASVARALEVALVDLVADPPAPTGPRAAIALLGLRGAGKSTVGPGVAEALGLPFVELDQEIEEAAGLSLTEIFSLHGEPYYRRLEAQCVRALFSNGRASVVAMPGGVVHNDEAFGAVRRFCTTVWLKAGPEDHMRRVLRQGDRRPMANRPNAMAELRLLLAAREPLYAQAEITLDTSRYDRRGTVRALLAALLRAGWATR